MKSILVYAIYMFAEIISAAMIMFLDFEKST